MSKISLTNAQLMQQTPALFTEEPYYEVSQKYYFIQTIEVINEIKKHNWYPVSVSEAKVRDEKKGYKQHLVTISWLHKKTLLSYCSLIAMTEAGALPYQQVSFVTFVQTALLSLRMCSNPIKSST